MGERSLALCGRIADALIVSNMCPPGYTEHAVGIVEASAERSGRPRPGIVQYVPCVVRPDRDEAWRTAKAAIGGMLTTFWPVGDDWPPLRDMIVRHSGIAKPEVIGALDRLRLGEHAAAGSRRSVRRCVCHCRNRRRLSCRSLALSPCRRGRAGADLCRQPAGGRHGLSRRSGRRRRRSCAGLAGGLGLLLEQFHPGRARESSPVIARSVATKQSPAR